ncbi:YSIRK-type signal peptide-containing protein [Limosilactobacillus ingluviei]|uniref:YSIRK-type signal peptide-containing protein n=1 Tax=Limosilactobacillus ingluviei TaxID=148604 RepID=UPI0002D55422|nr:YSIRK-type signal peptide-containing protein [Limosilactobacillus ingluviei]
MLRKIQAEKCHQRFALRKLSVGVVSVLLGVTLFGVNLVGTDTVAKADSSTSTQNGGGI